MNYITCFFIFIALFLLSPTLHAKLISLTPSTFNDQIKLPVPTVVAFIAPWCGHCQRAKPELEKAANSLGGVVHFATVDCEEYKDLAAQHQIKGFPTIKIFSNKGKKVDDYNGARSANAFVNYAMSYLNKMPDPVKVLSTSKQVLDFANEKTDKPRVLLLTAKATNPALFKSLAIEFESQPFEFAVAVNSESYSNELASIGVENVPTLIFLTVPTDGNYDLKERIVIYGGSLKKEEILKHIKTIFKNDATLNEKSEEKKEATIKQVIPKVKEVTSQKDIDTNCENLCILGLVKNDEKNVLFSTIAKTHNEQGFPFLAVDINKYSDLKNQLGIEDDSELILVALRLKKKKYARSSIIKEASDADSFLDRITYGDITYSAYKNTPSFHEEF